MKKWFTCCVSALLMTVFISCQKEDALLKKPSPFFDLDRQVDSLRKAGHIVIVTDEPVTEELMRKTALSLDSMHRYEKGELYRVHAPYLKKPSPNFFNRK